ncbi:MAG TPA: glycosyltransferase family 4 protein [Casimicrobiaceae bacterium]|nr:glycosyltransferase family 4 protein [Casimicrobiaceae bacterium]
MRIAIIRQRYTPYGGAERFVEGALEALLERNVAITLYTREWPQTKLQLLEPHIVDPFYVGGLWRDWGFARAVCRAVGHAHLDLVQSHERLTCCDIFRAGDGVHAVWLEERLKAAGAAKRLSVALSPHHRYILAMEKRMFRSPWLSAVICNSTMVRDEVRDRFAVPESKLHVVYNAVDCDDFSPALKRERAAQRVRLRIPEDAVVYLLVGSGFERKGVATAIEALAEVPAPAHLVVVGRDKDPAHYAQLARRHGVENRVVLAGPQLDPRPYYGAADAFVLPSLYDPFPNAALEAMACALPVVTSTKSGSAELVRAHDAGLVCPSRDVAGLASHMRLLLDPAQRERFGSRAREAVLPLTPAAMTLKLVLLYRELLAGIVARRQARRASAHASAQRRVAAAAEPASEPPAAEPSAGAAPEGPERPPDGTSDPAR